VSDSVAGTVTYNTNAGSLGAVTASAGSAYILINT
jgi:hypothetical protein